MGRLVTFSCGWACVQTLLNILVGFLVWSAVCADGPEALEDWITDSSGVNGCPKLNLFLQSSYKDKHTSTHKQLHEMPRCYKSAQSQNHCAYAPATKVTAE